MAFSAPYANIFDFMRNPNGGDVGAVGTTSWNDVDQGWSTDTGGWNEDANMPVSHVYNFAPQYENLKDLINPVYGGVSSGEDPGKPMPNQYNIDWSKAPKSDFADTFGGMDKMVGFNGATKESGIGDGKAVYNKDLVKWDDNYGWITPQWNLKDNSPWYFKYAPQMIMAATGAGMGAIAPGMSMGMKLASLGNSIMSGSLNPISLLGQGLGMVNPALGQIYNMANSGLNLANAVKNKDPIGGLSNLYRLGSGLNITGGG